MELTKEQKIDRIRQCCYIEYCKNKENDWKCFWAKDVYCVITNYDQYQLNLQGKAESVYDKITDYLKLDFIDYRVGFSDNLRAFSYITEKCA